MPCLSLRINSPRAQPPQGKAIWPVLKCTEQGWGLENRGKTQQRTGSNAEAMAAFPSPATAVAQSAETASSFKQRSEHQLSPGYPRIAMPRIGMYLSLPRGLNRRAEASSFGQSHPPRCLPSPSVFNRCKTSGGCELRGTKFQRVTL